MMGESELKTKPDLFRNNYQIFFDNERQKNQEVHDPKKKQNR